MESGQRPGEVSAHAPVCRPNGPIVPPQRVKMRTLGPLGRRNLGSLLASPGRRPGLEERWAFGPAAALVFGE